MAKMIGVGSFNRKLKAMLPEIKKELRQAIAQGAEQIVSHQKRMAPVDDGDLQMSITWRWGNEAPVKYASMKFGAASRGTVEPELMAIITAGNTRVRYAHIVEFGAKGHVIAPKNTQGSLYIEGKWLAPGQKVNHPGQKAQPFFYPTFRANKRSAKARITRAISKAVKRVASS